MKKIIKGKLYDTETARKLAEWDNRDYGSATLVEEHLYKKKTGEYFIKYYGGAMSRYAMFYGTVTSGSEGITPLTIEEAREWLEKKASAETYLEEFEAEE